MRIALLNIPDCGKSGKGYSAPLGLAYIGAVVRNFGHEVRAYDLCVTKNSLGRFYLKVDEDVCSRIAGFRPDIAGMSCTTTNRVNVNFWADELKRRLPEAKIVVGGPHPFFIPENYLKSCRSVDVVIMGEGERTIAEYIEALEGRRRLEQVNGLAFRQADESIVITKPRAPIDNLDEITFPARDLFPMSEYDLSFGPISGKTATIITSRGCGNACKFCSTARYWRKVRYRSAGNIVDEIEQIRRAFPFIQNFVFFDDTLTFNREHATALCDEIVRRRLEIRWGCWSRTNCIDEQFARRLRDAGCVVLSFGIESGNDETLKTIRKNATAADNLRALRVGREQGICTRGTMIAGMPEEKFPNALDSVFFMAASGVPPSDLRMSLKTFIFPGTYWEKWFRERHPDFSWEAIPERFKRGSILDEYGNIVLPCYRWTGLPYYALLALTRMVLFPPAKSLLAVPWVQRTIKSILRLVVRSEYPREACGEPVGTNRKGGVHAPARD